MTINVTLGSAGFPLRSLKVGAYDAHHRYTSTSVAASVSYILQLLPSKFGLPFSVCDDADVIAASPAGKGMLATGSGRSALDVPADDEKFGDPSG